MADELLDRLVGPGFKEDAAQIRAFREDLRELVKTFGEVNEAAKKNEGMMAQSTSIKQVADAEKALATVHDQLAVSSAKIAASLAEVAGVTDKLIRLTNDEKKAQDNANNAALNAAKVREATAAATDKELKAKLTALKVAEQEEKQSRKTEKAVRDLDSAYAKANKEHLALKREAQAVGYELGVESKEFQKLAAEANKLDARLKEVDTALGDNRRKVGSYSEAIEGAGAKVLVFSNFLRNSGNEVDALARIFGFSKSSVDDFRVALEHATQYLARFFDMFNKKKSEGGDDKLASSFAGLKTKIDETATSNQTLAKSQQTVAATSGTASKALSLFKGALIGLGVAGAISLVILLIQKWRDYREELGHIREEEERRKASLKELAELQGKANEAEASGASTLDLTYRRTQNAALSTKERTAAVRELQDQFPAYFKNMSTEAILAGQAADAYLELRDALVAKARAGVYNDKYSEELRKELDLEEKIAAKRKELAATGDQSGTTYDANGRATLTFDNQKRASAGARLSGEIRELEGELRDIAGRRLRFQEMYEEAMAGGIVRKEDKKPANAARQEFQGLKELNDAKAELDKQRIQQDMEANEEIFQNEENSLEARKAAYERYTEDRRMIADAVQTAEIANAKAQGIAMTKLLKDGQPRTAEEIASLTAVLEASRVKEQAAVERHAATLAKIKTESSKYQQKLEEDEQEKRYQAVIAGLKKIESAYTAEYTRRKAGLDGQLQKGLISQQQYNKELAALNNATAKDVYQAQIENLEDLIKLFPEGSEEGSKLANALAEIKKQLGGVKAEAGTVGLLGISDKQMQKLTDAFSVARSLAQEFGDFQAALAQRRQKELDDELEKVNKLRDAEVARVETSALTEEEKADRIKTINANAEEQERMIEQDRITRQRKNAAFQKAATITQISLETLLAGIKALNDYSVPNFYVRLVNAGVAAAYGGLKIAAAAAVPLPGYHDGTGDTPHPGGKAWISEGNTLEYVKEPNKPGYFTSQMQVRDLAGGAHVTSQADLLKLFSYYTVGAPALIPQHLQQNGPSMDEVVQSIDKLTSVVKNKPEPQMNFSWRGVMKQARVGSSTINRVITQRHH